MVSKKGTGCTFRHKKGTALFKAKKCGGLRVHMKGKGGTKAKGKGGTKAKAATAPTVKRNTRSGRYM